MADKVIAKIFKYNPTVEREPTYRTYEVPWREWITVLEVLRYIHEEIEPISFDWGCRIARCGTCGLQVNKQPVLSCVTVAEPGEILIDPLRNLPVIRDLVVDRSEINRKLLDVKPWLVRSQPLFDVPDIPRETFQRVEALQLCIDCLLCHSVCPVVGEKSLEKFAGPWILMKIAMRYYDPRDEAIEERLRTAVGHGLFECTLCGMCTDVCPQGGLLRDQERFKSASLGAYELVRRHDEVLARRFYCEPSIDHVAVLQELQHKAKETATIGY